jgi:Spy/CpxP family protein refolding chaperone
MSWILLFSAVAVVSGYASSAVAQKAEGGKAKRSRLPNHYAKVVTEEQRSKINAIQEQYAPQIDKLRDELDAVVDKRDADIEKVLTPAQRKEVEKLRAESQARRAKADSEADGDAAESEPAEAAPKASPKAKKAA